MKNETQTGFGDIVSRLPMQLTIINKQENQNAHVWAFGGLNVFCRGTQMFFQRWGRCASAKP